MAVVEDFFKIIYGVHVEMEGRGGKHAGQKRTYRAVSYTFIGARDNRRETISRYG